MFKFLKNLFRNKKKSILDNLPKRIEIKEGVYALIDREEENICSVSIMCRADKYISEEEVKEFILKVSNGDI